MREGEVFRSDHFIATREAGGRLFRLKRTTMPLDDRGIADAVAFFERFVATSLRSHYVILLDSRDAPMTGDPDMERRVKAAGVTMLTGFARSAILVRTALGKLQATRLTRESRRVPVFGDEAAALEYLLDGISLE
ncbi:MAG: hypothetical protein IPM54_27845 [Polyangiaceae bacterium]|nr:hypothetical protein [Polyangiaceae bacterium]